MFRIFRLGFSSIFTIIIVLMIYKRLHSIINSSDVKVPVKSDLPSFKDHILPPVKVKTIPKGRPNKSQSPDIPGNVDINHMDTPGYKSDLPSSIRLKYLAPVDTIIPKGRPNMSSSQDLPGNVYGSHWDTPGYRRILLWFDMFGDKPTEVLNKVFRRILTKDCEICNCAFSVDRNLISEADAVVFHSFNLILSNFEDIPDPKTRKWNQLWIFMAYETYFESLGSGMGSSILKKNLYHVPYQNFNNFFNLTMSFRQDSDIIASHGITISKEDLKYHKDQLDVRPYPPFDPKKQLLKTHPAAWFVSHCFANNYREKYYALLSHNIGADKYGKCGKLKCGEMRRMKFKSDFWGDPCFELVNNEYHFLIAFENALCKDYVTEKVYNALLHNAIPILLTGSIEQNKILPPHSVINSALFKTPTILGNYLKYLRENHTAYMEYFAWRSSHHVVSFFSVPDTCPLCAKVNEMFKSGERKVLPSLQRWYVKEAKCNKPWPNMKLSDWMKQWTTFKPEKDIIIQEWLQRN